MFYGLLISACLSVVVGPVFDICGRTMVIQISYLFLVGVICTLPEMPSLNWLTVNRTIGQIAI